MDRKKNTTRNAIWGFINRCLGLLFPFILRTLIIYYLGIEYVGINALFASILQTLSLADLGFNTAVVYSMYKPVAEGDEDKICQLLCFYKKIYRWVGIIMLVGGLAILPFIRYFIAGDVPDDINIYIVYIICLANTVLSYLLFAYKTSILDTHQRIDIETKISSAVSFFMYIFQIFVIVILKNYYLYLIMGPIFLIITNIVRLIIVNRLYPQYNKKGKLPKKEKSIIFKNVKALFIMKVGGILSNSADSIIISAFLGVTILGIYSNYYLIITSVYGFLIVYYGAMMASVGNSLVVESKNTNWNTFITLVFIQGVLISWVCVCLGCLFQPFMKIWVGEDLLLDISSVILFVVYVYVWKINDIVAVYKDALGLWHPDRYRALLEGMLNVSLNLILVNYFGVNGAIISTIIAILCVSWSWMPKVLFKGYFKDGLSTYYKYVFGFFVYTIVLYAICYLLCGFINTDFEWVNLAIKFLICCIIPFLLCIILFWKTKVFNNARLWLRQVIKK